MKSWLLYVKPDDFILENAIRSMETFQWKAMPGMNADDTVYLYYTNGLDKMRQGSIGRNARKRIAYKCKVIGNIEHVSDFKPDRQFWLLSESELMEKKLEYDKCINFVRLGEFCPVVGSPITSDEITKFLREADIKYWPRGLGFEIPSNLEAILEKRFRDK